MIPTSLEKKYIVNKRGRKILIEIRKTRDGKTIVTVEKVFKHVFEKDDSEMEWSQEFKDAEEIDYEKLPAEVRRVLSALTRY
ncbi:MAG: hypothetical protein ABWJ42_00915 [Sulfolobales archaeon]